MLCNTRIGMSLKRNARAAAILQTRAVIQDILNEPPDKKRKKKQLPIFKDGIPMLYGIQAGQRQEEFLRFVVPTVWVTRREVLHRQCMVCLSDSIDATELALFTGSSGTHSSKCPLTQPGTLCFSCAAGAIGTSWNEWKQQPNCPCCRTPISESTVIRICVR